MAHEELTWEQEIWFRSLPVEEQQRILQHLRTGEYVLVKGDKDGAFVITWIGSEDESR